MHNRYQNTAIVIGWGLLVLGCQQPTIGFTDSTKKPVVQWEDLVEARAPKVTKEMKAKRSHPPVVEGEEVGVQRNVALTYQIIGHDPDRDPLEYFVSEPNHGTLSKFDPWLGSFTYIPYPDFVGSDEIIIYASDGFQESEKQKLIINVMNQNPTATRGQVEGVKNEPVTGTLHGEDQDGDSVAYELVQTPSWGYLELDRTNGDFTYTPKPGFSGQDLFSYVVTDGSGRSEPMDVAITITNRAPFVNSEPGKEHKIYITPENSFDIKYLVRDMQTAHSDFQVSPGGYDRATLNMVEDELDSEGKPVFAGENGYGGIATADSFSQWFRDIPGVNTKLTKTMTLQRIEGTSSYAYSNREFFPIDNQGFGNEGNDHNFHFTVEIETLFTYRGGETFSFRTSGATKHDVSLMRKIGGADIGVKASGGIRTLENALTMISAGADRIGCSASVAILNELYAKQS